MLLRRCIELNFIIVNFMEVQTCSYGFAKSYGELPGNNQGFPFFA